MAYTTIDKPTDYFNTLLYTGDGSSSRSITGVGFAPDWIWVKERSSTSQHQLVDKVRGFDKRLQSDSGDPEDDDSSPFLDFKSLDSDGWTMGNGGAINESGQTYVSWNWLAGGSASSNTDGSITSSVSANTTAGFSIVSYTGNGVSGATIGHGLSTTAPKIVLIKKRSGSDNWTMLNKNISLNTHLHLNRDDGAVSDPMFNNTAPTTSVFTVDSDGQVNENGLTFIAYCFSEVKGYSKFGSYTGNGSTDATFIFTGFKPAWVLVKRTDASGNNWQLHDIKRTQFAQPINHRIAPNVNIIEQTGDTLGFEFFANGFRPNSTNPDYNGSGSTYIYLAFAESPFVTSTGIPTTAR